MFQLWPRGAFQEALAARRGKAGRLLRPGWLGVHPGALESLPPAPEPQPGDFLPWVSNSDTQGGQAGGLSR